MLLWHINTLAKADSAPVVSQSNSVNFAQRAEKAFIAAKTRFETETSNPEAKWQFGRTCYDWADFATSDKQRADIAQQGIAACRELIERNIDSAPGHYYLAMNLGQLAQTKSLGALKIVRQMEGEFKIALGLDPKYDFAGADRGLGLLYLEAPGWPTSIGSKPKARQHLQKALKLFPDFPENLLNQIEAEIKWDDKRDAIRDLTALDVLWPTARKQFEGDKWAPSWADWEKRRGLAESKVAGTRKAPGSTR
jgi:tetratricopeptide (TPR) repeat protein